MNRTKRSRTRPLIGVVAALSMALVFYAVPASAAAGPYLVKDINPGFEDSTPRWLTEMNGTLYFGARGATGGRELWRSAGSSGATNRVKDIRPGAKGSDPMALASVGGVLYFSANDGVKGRELWVSDGTGAGTRLVSDIRPGSAGSDPRDFTAFQGNVYFSADDGSTGRELWRTDGTALGTHLVKDLTPGSEGSNPEGLVPFSGKLFFLGPCVPSCDLFGQHTLFRTYGTAASTQPFKGQDGEIFSGGVRVLGVSGGRLYFNFSTAYGSDRDGLWRSNGTAATTRKIAHLGTTAVADVGGTLFMNVGGEQLWKSDGTAATTVFIKEAAMYSDFLFVGVGSKLFFDAEYGDWWHTLWVSDGTPDGTQPLKSVYTRTRESAAIGSILYFAGLSNSGYTLWRSNGTANGTYSLGGTEAYMWDVTAVGNSIYWVSDAADHGNELWRYVP